FSDRLGGLIMGKRNNKSIKLAMEDSFRQSSI
ncbi:MAG: hypothetical protein ACI85Q_002678, partial [Salibacteraceae bacterium]